MGVGINHKEMFLRQNNHLIPKIISREYLLISIVPFLDSIHDLKDRVLLLVIFLDYLQRI